MDPSLLLLERLGSLIQQSIRDDAARHGLLPVHVQVMHYLANANRYSDLPIAVAEYLGVTRGTISQSLSVLERKGFLRKESDASDGRRVHLKLTEAGEGVLKGSWAEQLELAFNGLSIKRQDIELALRNILIALQRLNRQKAFGICHQCQHYLPEGNDGRCALTGETLTRDQSLKICREWTQPK